MEATWKKCVCFLVLAAAASLACHFLTARYLLEPPKPRYAQTNPLMAIVFGARPKDESWAQGVATGMLEHVYLPWPLRPLGPRVKACTFDANNARAIGAETIMGLALLGPPPDPAQTCEVSSSDRFRRRTDRSVHELRREHLAWFRKMSALAIARAGDANIKRDFERLALFVENAALRVEEHGGTSAEDENLPASAPAEAPLQDRAGEQIWARAKQIDPTNAVYFYDHAFRTLRGVIDERDCSQWKPTTLPSDDMAQTFKLKDEASFVPTARKLDELLTAAEEKATIHRYRACQRRLLDRAFSFRYPHMGPSAAFWAPVGWVTPLYSVRSLSLYRHLSKRLCFMGDRLAARGQDALALRMYRHAYKLGERLITAMGPDADLLDSLIGMACLSLARGHLMEFWARGANAAKVVEAGRFQGHVDHKFYQLAAKSRATRVAPRGGNDAGFITYLRSAGLTWWFGLSGIAMVAFSLLCASLYMLGRRRRKLSSPSVRLQKGPLLAVTVFPVAAIFGLGLLIPLDFQTMPSASAAALWGLVLTGGWIVAVGLLARRAAGEARDVRRSPTGWVWPIGVLATLAVAASATIWDETPIVTAAVIAWLGTLGCVAIWLIAVLISWAARKTPADRAYRRAVNKSFAVCTIFVAAVALLATLATVPLTRHQQDEYYEQFRAEQTDEVRVRLGDDWAESFDGLDPEVFLLEASPKTQP